MCCIISVLPMASSNAQRIIASYNDDAAFPGEISHAFCSFSSKLFVVPCRPIDRLVNRVQTLSPFYRVTFNKQSPLMSLLANGERPFGPGTSHELYRFHKNEHRMKIMRRVDSRTEIYIYRKLKSLIDGDLKGTL